MHAVSEGIPFLRDIKRCTGFLFAATIVSHVDQQFEC